MLRCVFCDDVIFVFNITQNFVRGVENLAFIGIRTRTVQPVTCRYTDWATPACWRNGQKNYMREEIISWMDRGTTKFCTKTLPFLLRFKSKTLERNCVWDKLLDTSQGNMEDVAKDGAHKHGIYDIILVYFTTSNKCTIISQIITLLHVSTPSCYPQGALANITKQITQFDTQSHSVHTVPARQ